ncbi:hypothetical protein [Roseburia sp. 499]|uniref:hypothetical protein n=1 Tax=Roseburia sp. 499 TaxID=1261634 RepID=UPI000951F892|nr:hypothetical protein [Roseburia sp. 499]WVK70594.1 hypothetical protein BIV20_03430 [Roseburia sp. 499]
MQGMAFTAATTYNLKLQEDEYEKLMTLYSELGDLVDEKMETYIKFLSEMTNESIVKGALHDKLQIFLEAVQLYQNTFSNTCKEVVSKLEQFIISIDELDEDIYGAGCNTIR